MDRDFRVKFFTKLAQQGLVVNPPIIIKDAPSISALDAYPNILTGWSSASIPIINNIVHMLNIASNIATNNKYNLQTLKSNSFAFGDSEFSSPVKDILMFFRQVFIKILNNGNNFNKKLTAIEIAKRVDTLLAMPELLKMSEVNPTGPISQKIPGNFQQDIKNNLNLLKNMV